MTEKTVAIVEDEALLALDLQDLCEACGCRVLGTAATARDALHRFADLQPDLLITDMELADGSNGVEVVEGLRQRRPDMTVIFVTAATAPGKLQRIAAACPNRVLEKPLRPVALREALAYTFR